MIRFMCVLQVDSDQLQNTLREFVLKAVFINIENRLYRYPTILTYLAGNHFVFSPLISLSIYWLPFHCDKIPLAHFIDIAINPADIHHFWSLRFYQDAQMMLHASIHIKVGSITSRININLILHHRNSTLLLHCCKARKPDWKGKEAIFPVERNLLQKWLGVNDDRSEKIEYICGYVVSIFHKKI